MSNRTSPAAAAGMRKFDLSDTAKQPRLQLGNELEKLIRQLAAGIVQFIQN